MFGQLTNFKCPCCNHTGIINLGITQFVTIRGDYLALSNFPKCNKLISFKMVGTKSEPTISYDVSGIDESEIKKEDGLVCF